MRIIARKLPNPCVLLAETRELHGNTCVLTGLFRLSLSRQ